MDETTARGLVERAAEAWWLEEAASLPDTVNERSVTHRLAMHLERLVRDHELGLLGPGVEPAEVFVDCEYNRHGNDPKRVRVVADHVGRGVRREDWPSDTQGRTVFPDITPDCGMGVAGQVLYRHGRHDGEARCPEAAPRRS